MVGVLIGAVGAGCGSSEEDTTPATETSAGALGERTTTPGQQTTTGEQTTTTVIASTTVLASAPATSSVSAGPTRDEVAAVLYGTATCVDDPTCEVVTDVSVAGDFLQIQTALFRDADAEIPGLSACNAVAAQLWPGFVQVLGSDGGVIASGSRDQVPFCEVRL
jgi:hypothetical protein